MTGREVALLFRPDYELQRLVRAPEAARREWRLELIRARVAGRIVSETEEG
jgi:hypothetical protein